MRLKALAGFVLLGWTAAAFAQAAPPQFKFEMHGFASGTLYMQDGQTGSASGGTAFNASAVQPTVDKLMFSADARQSRFNWSVSGPQVMGGATPKAVLEIDWYGNFGAGNNGPIHLIPRARLLYAELNWGAHRLVFGQNYDLTAAMGPVSTAHVANPLTLGAGNAGFRRPGVFGYHTFGDLKNKDAMKVEVAWEVGRSQWADLGSGGVAGGFNGIGSASCTLTNGSVPGICAGEASGLPAVQGRISVLAGQNFSAYLGGHWNRADRSGMGITDGQPSGSSQATLDVVAGVVGAKAVVGPFTAAGQFFTGKNVAVLIATPNAGSFTAGGDVHEYGGWAQLGFNFTKELSLWAFGGFDKVNDNDLPGSGYLASRNVNTSGLLQYRDGGYALGLEFAHFRTTYVNPTSAANVAAGYNSGNVQEANQLALTGIYYF